MWKACCAEGKMLVWGCMAAERSFHTPLEEVQRSEYKNE